MQQRMLRLTTLLLLVLLAFGSSTPRQTRSGAFDPLTQLQQAAIGEVELTWNPRTQTPSFLRGAIPLSSIQLSSSNDQSELALAFVQQYGAILGVNDPEQELRVVDTVIDTLGMQHITLQQTSQGIPVYGAQIKIHIQSQQVVALSNSFSPEVQVAATQPAIRAEQALNLALAALPDGIALEAPKLMVYPLVTPSTTSMQLAWMVELRDDALPARNLYVISAMDGSILDILQRLHTGRVRQTYDAGHSYSLPGTLARAEGESAIGDTDIDYAHDFAGATYDYFANTHGRDSYDDQGAPLTSTAHYGNNYVNAFWNGSQVVYGDRMVVNDVVAHEWTHAVTEHSAALEYRWQSGALNESFSDIFGAMVDRGDWLIGEDLPDELLGGREALRDMANPARFGQPAHTDDWVETCSDNEGVHINSGITNRAYYNIVSALGNEKAERVFFRTLTVYLGSTSSLEDARAAALQSVADLYGNATAEYNAVRDGFAAVGLDGIWQPPSNDCTCAAATALSDPVIVTQQLSIFEIAATLYQVRDRLLSHGAGLQYLELYEAYSPRISALLLQNAELRTSGANLLVQITPGMQQVLGQNNEQDVVTKQLVADLRAFLHRLAETAYAQGDTELAETIEREISRVDWDGLIGMTYTQAWDAIQASIANRTLYLPIVTN